MKYTTICDCLQQTAFKSCLIRLLYERSLMGESQEELEAFHVKLDEFVNRWYPTLKDCPCKQKEQNDTVEK